MNTLVLKEEVWAIMQIFLNAQESFKVIRQINSLEEESSVVTKNDFLQYMKIICWRNTVTELAKLLSANSSDHYNIKDFLKRLKEQPSQPIALSVIEGWERSLSRKNKDVEDILLQRNKVYAHTDRDQSKVKNIVTLGRTEELLTTIFDVIDTVYNHFFETTILREPISDIGNDLAAISESLIMRDQVLEKVENGELLI